MRDRYPNIVTSLSKADGLSTQITIELIPQLQEPQSQLVRTRETVEYAYSVYKRSMRLTLLCKLSRCTSVLALIHSPRLYLRCWQQSTSSHGAGKLQVRFSRKSYASSFRCITCRLICNTVLVLIDICHVHMELPTFDLLQRPV